MSVYMAMPIYDLQSPMPVLNCISYQFANFCQNKLANLFYSWQVL